MKTNLKTIIFIAGSTLILGFGLGWLFFGGSENNSTVEHQHSSEMTSDTLPVKQTVIWTCSMHPQIRRNEPGKCPICGMQLIPLEQEQGVLDAMAVGMSATAMQLANVSTALVGTMNPVKSVTLNGKVQADERLVFSQSSHIPGRIEKLMVNFTGEYLKKGQVIAAIYSPEMVTAQEELFFFFFIKETQPLLFQAAKEKLKNWKLSYEQIEEILRSGSPKETFDVLADVSGYVTVKKVNPGDYIVKGETIYEIADLSKVWILFDVYESDIPWVKRGDMVTYTIQSLPGQSFQGTISYLDPVIDPNTRVANARIAVDNSSLKFKPEMFASGTVKAKMPQKSDAIVIPKTAVMWTGKRSVVYVKYASDHGVNFMMREVTLGPALGDSFIIESGLQEGEEIAVHGTFSIDAAAQLSGKPSMMNPSGGPATTGHNHGEMKMPVSTEQSNNTSDKRTAIGQKAKVALQPLFSQYLNLKDALVADNMADAQKAAGNMQTALSKVNTALFTGESHNVWMKYSTDLQSALQHVAHFEKIDEMRKAFQQISVAMIGLSKSYNPFKKPLYVQHCPMADNNKGADWISLSKEIRNPYFGASMLTCGEVTKEIK
jgi:Cu(I)/Ag(I) efflux system membrane fusion protein